MTVHLDEDAITAAVELVGRTGATELQVGYLHDDVPAEKADWYAHAQYRGARISVEHHLGPVQALEALAQRLLVGGKCTHCGRLVTLSDDGALLYEGALFSDGSTAPTPDEVRAFGACRWRRHGPHWVRGCEGIERRATRRDKQERKRRKAKRKRGRR